ncbi:amino acid permease [Acidianus sulfidivorans JP7]|uniref:Amino acid transporter n=1 Tax=Acidianus sulfidivorans JP7 TaxID=619593 RepID=A0A2U9IJS6_9CREN|nr:amino acid permease [Acidianus sulfidivorans]AWR96287.1 amino acid permease [Acidianus sulfidivorans JP7]
MERKKLNLIEATAVGLGNIIGAGIFVMAGSIIYLAGPGAIISFIITGILAMTIGLNSAELASKFPKTEGGVYSFAKLTMGDSVGFLVGWMRMISYAVSGAATALGFASYLPIPKFQYIIAGLLIIILSIIYLFGLKLASEIETALVIINVLGLVLFIAFSLSVGKFSVSHFTPISPHGISGILSGASLAFFAYSGFNTIATLTPDVENGEKTVPKAIVLSLIITSILYILVVFSMLYLLPWQIYGIQGNPLSFALQQVKAPEIITVIISSTAIIATVTVTLSIIIASARTLKQMAEDELIPNKLSKDSISIGIITAIMISSLSLGNVELIGLVSNFGTIFSYIITPVAVVISRRRGMLGTFKSPFYPILQIIAVILSLVVTISLGKESLMLGVLSLIIGLLIHETHVQINIIEKGKRLSPHGKI